MAVTTHTFTIRTVSLAAAAVAASVAIPFAVHLLPAGSSVGAALLPIFWAPLLAAAFFGPVPAVAAAVLAPVLNHLVTGMPPEFIVPGLTAELIVFVAVLFVAHRSDRLKRSLVVAPIAYLVARLAVGGALILAGRAPAGWSGLSASLIDAWPGYLALLLLGLVIRLATPRGANR